jgi:hypothetical protein
MTVTVDDIRRGVLVGLGGLTLGAVGLVTGSAQAAAIEIIAPGASDLPELTANLRCAPRRRDFKTVPMILSHPDLWDDEALNEVAAELTNHLIDGVVLTPGMAATIPELQQNGFHYVA